MWSTSHYSIICLKPLLLLDCTYLFIEQPPTDIYCNPYNEFRTDEVLSLQCALTAPVGSPITINWYHNGSPQSDGVNELPTVTSINTNTFRSVLSLTDPQPVTDSGDYYCQAAVDGEDLLPSETFTLSSDVFAYINLGECVNMDTFSRSATKCADILPTLIVTYLTTTDQHSPTLKTTESHTTTDHTTTQGNPAPVQAMSNIRLYILAIVVGVVCVIIITLGTFICRKKSELIPLS